MTNFITNAQEQSLKDRIATLIHYSKELKFLVGFFYFSGWKELYKALRTRSDLKMKILVGLDTDIHMGSAIEIADSQTQNRTQHELVRRYYCSLQTALRDEILDTSSFYEQAPFFVQLLEENRLEIRKTFDPNHAKLYLFCLDEAGQAVSNTPGRFITGSSNLTHAGLSGQNEFNVEIGDYGWREAEAFFDDLWRNAILLSELPERKMQLLRIIRRQTQIAEISPFEAYALVLKTYLDMMEQKVIRPNVRRLMEEHGYVTYRYQEEAVQQALSVIDQYNGVILADVVGLGKSVIASRLARERNGRGLVICPPSLMGDPKTRTSGWYKYLSDFGLNDWDVYSVGALDQVQEYLTVYGDDIETIIVDEAHRFRNEDTEAYERLSQICANRAVILLTATPFNNTPSDIFALLKLFIPPGKSTLTLDENLTARFARYNSEFRKLSHILRHHNAGGDKQANAEKYYKELFNKTPPMDLSLVRQRASQLANEIRAIIEPVVIRRNRLDLQHDPIYAQEVTMLSEVADPIELFYELTEEQSAFYDQVINEYFGEDGRFRGAIYQPFAYEKKRRLDNLNEEDNRIYLQQQNLYDFMRRLLVKRFESSIGAFMQSIQNFIHVHEHVMEFIQNSGGLYILDRSLVEKIYSADPDEINIALEDFIRRLAAKEKLDPRHDRIYIVNKFDDQQGFLQDIQSDLDLLKFIRARVQELNLMTDDPKVKCLIKAIAEILNRVTLPGEPCRKVVVFSEYLDTVSYIAPIVRRAFSERVLIAEGNLGKTFFAELLANFDASYPLDKQCDDFDILVTSDKLSEGINLNRAGAVINYDIPWNPTRVIQRLGRINRIGRKVFESLNIYNFFPTRQGADIVQSREIAAQKMFLIHNTLGEDAKVFAPDETPSPAELFRRINRNPEEEEEESILTSIRQQFFALQQTHPEVIEHLNDFPPRVKTAKDNSRNELFVFRRKGLQLFVHTVPETGASKIEVNPLPLEEALEHIRCEWNTPRQPLSANFWRSYEAIKNFREQIPMPLSDNALLVKAENNLRSALENYADELEDQLPFIQTLLRDLKEFQTLSKYSLRRLILIEMQKNISQKDLKRFQNIIDNLRRSLGDDYLERIEQRLKEFRSEIIIAIENISQTP